MEVVEEISKPPKVLGARVLVEKKRIDSGGMILTPSMEADGEKNEGTVLAMGQVGIRMRMRGLQVGSTILFKRHFIPNHVEGEVPLVFIECEDILAII